MAEPSGLNTVDTVIANSENRNQRADSHDPQPSRSTVVGHSSRTSEERHDDTESPTTDGIELQNLQTTSSTTAPVDATISPPNSNNLGGNRANEAPTPVVPHSRTTTPQSTPSLPNNPDSSETSTAPPSDPESTPVSDVTQIRTPKSIFSHIRALAVILISSVIVGLTAGFAFTSKHQHSPLGALSASNGILILTILGKMTDYVLLGSSSLACDTFQWGPLVRGSEKLLTFFALSSAAGVGAWFRIICRGWRKPFRQPEGGWGHMSRVWSLSRIVIWGAIQFPGIIILSVANPQTDYYPSNWTYVSGGIGLFNASMSNPGSYDPILLSGLVVNGMLRDSTRATPVKPITKECIEVGDNCTSYLVPGGLSNISPWPFKLANHSAEDFYMTRFEPVYHIDLWNVKTDVIWEETACQFYGYGSSTDGLFQLCIQWSTTQYGAIVAGWRFCTTVTSNGTCLYKFEDSRFNAIRFYSTNIAFHRHTASLAYSRTSQTILNVADFGPSKPHYIAPIDFRTVFNFMLGPWINGTSSNFCIAQTFQYRLTMHFMGILIVNPAGLEADQALDGLKSMFASSLYMFSTVTSAINGYPKITEPNLGLPDENYFNGSMAVSINHVVPELWTVISYVAVAGVIIVASVIARLLGLVLWGRDIPDASTFTGVDLFGIRYRKIDEVSGNVVDEGLHSLFTRLDQGDDSAALKKAVDVEIVLRDRGMQLNEQQHPMM